MSELPRQYVASLLEATVRFLEARKPKTDLVHLAREMLAAFSEIAQRAGLDALVPLGEDEQNVVAVTTQLGTIDLDGGGPRNKKPQQVVDSLIAGLGLELVDEPDRTIKLDDKVRTDVIAALHSALAADLALPKLRDTMIATARARIEEQHFSAFEKLAKNLDDRGQRIISQPKVPLDAVQATQKALAEARRILLERIGGVAIDRAQAVIAKANPEAAARIDAPVTVRSTPRELAILRAADGRVTKTAASVADSILASLTELARLAWQAPEIQARTYSPKETFAVGEWVDHPKFGRGKVTNVATSMPRFDIELADGTKVTLVHVQPKK
jgi:hypothetical protein